ncbi:MAG: hypothetical protein U0529_14545 [Thermoanaerobaculia bacterium]
MATKAQNSGMQGVYLAAAALSRQGLIVSPTARNAKGADLLVTDDECLHAFSVQVKTNRSKSNFWLVGEHARRLKAESHIYVLVNLLDASGNFEAYVVPSVSLAPLVKKQEARASTWWYVEKSDLTAFKEAWHIFSPVASAPPEGTLS